MCKFELSQSEECKVMNTRKLAANLEFWNVWLLFRLLLSLFPIVTCTFDWR